MTLTTDTAPPLPEGAPPAARSQRRFGDSPLLLRCSGVAAVLVVLELLTRFGVFSQAWFPPVSEIWLTFLRSLATTGFWADVGNTLLGWSIGLGLATALAVPAGMLIGSHPIPASAFRAIIEFIRPIPSVALIPLAVLLWGIDLQTKVFLVTFASFWPILFQALYGVQSVDQEQVQVTRVYRLGRGATFRHVVIPSIAPYIATGVRISSSIALALSVTAEIVVAAPGIGRSIMIAQASSVAIDMYALILATGLLGWGLNSLFLRIEKAALHWHPSYRQEKP